MTADFAVGQFQSSDAEGVFSGLNVGQAVSLKDEGSTYLISFFDDEIPLSHTVVEIGEDYVVVRDISE